MFTLLHNKVKKCKVAEIIARYEERNREIHYQFKGIDHGSNMGEECRKAFAQAHNDMVIELCKISETQ